jgi:hypothetical protein
MAAIIDDTNAHSPVVFQRFRFGTSRNCFDVG